MYENGTKSCPVAAFKLYTSHLSNKLNVLWQKPRKVINHEDKIWYCAVPVGINTLSNMMKTISTEKGLSRAYSNHSVRATTITRLSDAGVETRHIMNLTGHRNPHSIMSYNRDSSERQKRQFANILQGLPPLPGSSATYTPSSATATATPSTTAPVRPESVSLLSLSNNPSPTASSSTPVTMSNQQSATSTYTAAPVTISYRQSTQAAVHHYHHAGTDTVSTTVTTRDEEGVLRQDHDSRRRLSPKCTFTFNNCQVTINKN